MKFDVVIVGGGIIGLATCLKILERKPGLKVLILEKENNIAQHQTGNNSGVIHSGIYYKPGSLKAKNCRYGYNLLLEFCKKHEIKYEICGKVIVAINDKELNYLDVLIERGSANGLDNLKKLNSRELKEIEPNVSGVGGILVPQTGIIDFVQVSKKYLQLIQEYGALVNLNEKVINIIQRSDEIEIITDKNSYQTKTVISCAGLHADRVAKKTNPQLPVRIIPFRGEYYKLSEEKEYLVKSLIYPVPNPEFPFLGVHFTRLINGGIEAGPNAVLAFKREGYKKSSFNLIDTLETFAWGGFRKVVKDYWKTGLGEFYRSLNKKAFVRALQKLVPEIESQDLIPGGSGVRAQACDKKNGLFDDFYIYESGRIYHVCNAPSPAATSSLSIGEFLSEKVLSNIN